MWNQSKGKFPQRQSPAQNSCLSRSHNVSYIRNFRKDLSLITSSYLKTIQWNLFYYYRGIPSWDWHYPFNHGPFATDLLDVDAFDATFNLGRPVSTLTHLLAILPPQCEQLLPMALRDIVRTKLAHSYPVEVVRELMSSTLVNKRQWKNQTILPIIDKVMAVGWDLSCAIWYCSCVYFVTDYSILI